LGVIENTNSTLGFYIECKQYSYENLKFVSDLLKEYLNENP
jgi:hypothetical protein